MLKFQMLLWVRIFQMFSPPHQINTSLLLYIRFLPLAYEVMFPLCLQWTGPWSLVSGSRSQWYTSPWSQVLSGEYPSSWCQVPSGGGTPVSSSRSLPGMPHSLVPGAFWGTPIPYPTGRDQDRGAHSPPPWHDMLWRGYVADGTPLAVTQEDCLV